ncbi:MAG: phosphoribosylformylglycinamidine synthase subunit PurS [Leptospiraceae bacterium]|nr:phosphoribosylformylglycinamidine synthase subunit PurS [Leptospiraceae bacterium]MCP5511904.1 phosphoribosylformylglycinamidine synthase subunit PurS [Leptospiraceae bacterium]
MYIGKVNISLKKSVLDPQGTTVMNALHDMGEEFVNDVRIGKYVEVTLKSDSEDQAKEDLDRLCKKLLVNPIIETYSISVEKI